MGLNPSLWVFSNPSTTASSSRSSNVTSSLPLSMDRRNYLTTTTVVSSPYAVVNHARAYEHQMQGLHGKQLELAKLEGKNLDDEIYDPFLELEELERLEAESSMGDEGKEIEPDDHDEKDNDNENDEPSLEEPSSTRKESSIYNNDGSLRRKKSEKAILGAGYPSGGVFAIIELAGSQHKITTDDLLIVNKLKPVDSFKVGSVHTLTDVLLVGSTHMTLVGMPQVTGAEVDVMVEEITKDKKVIVFKHKRRKNYRRKIGHRREVTMLRVLDVRFPPQYEDHSKVERSTPELLKN